MSGLRDGLQGAATGLAAELRGGRFDEPARIGMRSRIRRGRVIRAARTTSLAAGVVGALVVAGWFGLGDRNGPPPVATPTPSPTSTPSPDPTPEVTQTPEVVLGDPIDEPGLPTYYAMPDGVLDHVGPGWVLATYAPVVEYQLQSDPAARAPLVEMVFLVSPEGTRYLVSRLDPGVAADASGATWVEHELVSWDTGDTGATVRELRYSVDARIFENVEDGPAQWLDLATGVLTPLGGDADPTPAGLSPDGSMVLPSRAGGERLVERVSDGSQIAELPPSSPAGWCQIVTWWTADSILAACLDDDLFALDGPGIDIARPRLVILALDELGSGAGTILRQIGPEEPFPYGLTGTYVADGVVAWVGADSRDWMECATGVYLQTGDRIEPLPASSDARAWVNSWVARAVDGVVYVEAQGSCASDSHPRILTAYDVATGTTTELVPAPPGDNPNDVWSQGLGSYVVGR